MKKFICLLLCLLLALTFVSCKNEVDADTENETEAPADTFPYTRSETETDYVLFDIKDYGKIVVELYPETAPITVENFKGLVADKFYDGLIFHRIIAGFMIQGGGYTTEYAEKDCPSIKGEFASNGVPNNLKHTRGVISMARTPDPNSASSQFFIMHQAAPHLDGDYAAFGNTVYGIETVDKIAVVATNYYDVPVEQVVITEAYFVTPNN